MARYAFMNPSSLFVSRESEPMSTKDVKFVRLLQVVGANIGVAVLSLVGLGVVFYFSKFPFFILLFIISLLQGGLMIRAFGPAVNCEKGLSLGGKIVGWFGFVGWFLIHLVNAGIAAIGVIQNSYWAVVVELTVYLSINTLVLIPFYKALFWGQRVISDHQQASLSNNRNEIDTQKQGDQNRRDNSRFACQLLYDQHAHRLQNLLPRERLSDYFEQHLSDTFPAEIVEIRAEQLKEMILLFLEQGDGNHQKFSSLNEIAEYFQKQKEEIESLQYDEQTQQTMLSSLNEQEDRTIREFLSS